MKEILDKIYNDQAKLIGEGEWVKDGAYQVYKVDEKFYSIIIYNWQNRELMDDSLKEIQENEINSYI